MDSCRSRRSKTSRIAIGLLLTVVFVGIGGSSFAAGNALQASDSGFDFGHAGIDFKLFHTFTLRNEGQKDITLHSANVTCECTTVLITDTLLKPGETTAVRITLDTYSLYGPNSKKFSIQTSDPSIPKFEYPYSCRVGQWPQGLKPDPINLFFLPGHRAKKVSIPNPACDKVSVVYVDQADAVYTVAITKADARKGERAEVEVTPKENLGPGTYFSSFRLRLELPEGATPVLLNIPVKIVRY